MPEAIQDPTVIRLIISGLLVLGVFIVRRLAVRWILRDARIVHELQRRQLFWMRTAITVVFIIALLAVWGGHLQNLVLSLTAVMVAIVIATKELLMCLTGFLLRTTGKLFSVGDWIECNGLRGEVTDQTLLSTTLLEVEPAEYGYGYTGRNLNLPNSVFLTHPVQTSPFARSYVPHRFTVSVAAGIDPEAGLEWLSDELERICTPFREEATRLSDSIDCRLGVDVEGPEPFVSLGTEHTGELQYRARVFCPRDRAAAIEREVIANFLSALHRGHFSVPREGAEHDMAE
ncbi:MAG: mechanosensitive ion channel family protein [Halofilum sp. (in: g-proteobacteria)]